MPLYATKYPLPNGAGAMTQVYARDFEHLQATIVQRGIREIADRPDLAVPAPVMPSEHLRMGDVVEALHAAIWVGMIATRAGIADAWALLCDSGPIHTLAHLVVTGGRRTIGLNDRVRAELEQLERATPGVHPSWAGETRDISAIEDLVLAQERQRAQIFAVRP